MELVTPDGTLTQYDAAGAHPLLDGVLSASVAFPASQEVLDVIFQDGRLDQFDPTGLHFLGQVFESGLGSRLMD